MKFSPLQSPAFMGLCLLSALAFGAATGNRSEDFPTSDLMTRDGGWESVSLLSEAITGLPHAGDGAAPDAPDPAKIRTASVFGNSDGEIGRKFANGELYTLESVAFASNEFALGTVVKVTSPEGRSVTAKVKDRMAKRFTHKRIDLTVKAWKQLTSRGYGLVRGCRVERVK